MKPKIRVCQQWIEGSFTKKYEMSNLKGIENYIETIQF